MRIVHLFGPSRIHPIYFTKWILHRGGSCRKRNQNFHYTKDEIIVLRKVCSNIGLGNGQWIKVKRSRTLHPALIIFLAIFCSLCFFMLREVENFVKNLQEGAILIYISSLWVLVYANFLYLPDSCGTCARPSMLSSAWFMRGSAWSWDGTIYDAQMSCKWEDYLQSLALHFPLNSF